MTLSVSVTTPGVQCDSFNVSHLKDNYLKPTKKNA
jgi:hypothetical protein